MMGAALVRATAPRLARWAMLRGSRWRRVGLGVVAGACLTLTLPPFGWWPLGPMGVAVLSGALGGAGWRVRLAAGGAAGLALYAPGLWWATEFNSAGWVVLVAVESALFGVAVALVPGDRRRGGGVASVPR